MHSLLHLSKLLLEYKLVRFNITIPHSIQLFQIIFDPSEFCDDPEHMTVIYILIPILFNYREKLMRGGPHIVEPKSFLLYVRLIYVKDHGTVIKSPSRRKVASALLYKSSHASLANTLLILVNTHQAHLVCWSR